MKVPCIVALVGVFGLEAVCAQALPPLVDLAADRELADHVGFPEQHEVTIGEYGSELIVYAAIIDSLMDTSLDPGQLNRIARDSGVYTENRYRYRVVLSENAFPTLLREASSNTYTATREHTEVAAVPQHYLQLAENSGDFFAVIAYYDRTAYLVIGTHSDVDAMMVDVWSPLTEGTSAPTVPFKSTSQLPATVIDRWEFFRITEES
ncbi:MAG TPA: hypothetical protein VJ932_06670 [Alkalispirochaeta sp.]|nr:hypothetical protein [Alkalispirochaeta sp.]